jgi:hypothetical protein
VLDSAATPAADAPVVAPDEPAVVPATAAEPVVKPAAKKPAAKKPATPES